MKKMFFIAAAAVASMTACTQIEVAEQNGEEINFNTMAVSTKALIFPGDNKDQKQALPTTEKFGVFAYVDRNYTSPLMGNVTVGADETGTWKGMEKDAQGNAITYIWPTSGAVDFYAYYPKSINGSFDTAAERISMTGVELGTTIGNQIDPMVAVTKDQNAASKPKVNLVFKHTTSQILVSAYDATETESLQGKIVLKNVVFNNVYTKGDYVDGTTSGKGNWDNATNMASFTVFSGAENLPVGLANESFLSNGSFTTAIDNNSAFVIIPEDVVVPAVPADPSQVYQSITVTYDVSQFTNGGYTFPKEENKSITFPINGMVTNDRFKPGVRYVFHLAFTLDKANNEIIFSPEVQGWEQEDINGILIDVKNDQLLDPDTKQPKA